MFENKHIGHISKSFKVTWIWCIYVWFKRVVKSHKTLLFQKWALYFFSTDSGSYHSVVFQQFSIVPMHIILKSQLSEMKPPLAVTCISILIPTCLANWQVCFLQQDLHRGPHLYRSKEDTPFTIHIKYITIMVISHPLSLTITKSNKQGACLDHFWWRNQP